MTRHLVLLLSVLWANLSLATAPASFQGTVRDSAQHSLSDATVEVLSDGKVVAEMRTDTDGHFQTPPLATGSYVLRTSHASLKRSTVVLDLGPETGPIDITLSGIAPVHNTKITGTRELPIAKTGASVIPISRDEITSLPGGDNQSLSSVLATQPGFVQDVFGFGLHVRGADGGLLWVIDGVPLLAAPLTEWGAAGGFVPTRLVQSMEVTTGGFPAEYGAGLGGVIDITTRSAVGPPSGEVQVAYGSFNTTHVALNYSQQIGRLSFFFGGDFEDTDRGLDPPSVSPILHDHSLSGSGFGTLTYAFDSGDRLEFITSYTQSFFQVPIDPTILPLSDAPPGAVRGTDVYGNPAPPFVPYNANPTEQERDFFAALSYTHKTHALTTQITPYVRESYVNLLCDPATTLGATADPGATCSDVGMDVWHGGAIADFRWKLGAMQNWKAGISLDYARSNDNYTAYTRNEESPIGGADPSQTISGKDQMNVLLGGLYVQDQIQVGKWTILPGVRMDLESAAFTSGGFAPDVMAGPNARLGASYAATDDIVVHGYVGYLWQPPNTLDGALAARYLLPSNTLAAPIAFDLKPETDVASEFGLTGRIWKRVTAGITVYGRYAWNQLDRQLVGDTNLMVSYNFKQGRALGVEIPINAVINDYFTAFANAAWQVAQGEGVESQKFLWSAADLANNSWGTLDHVQSWTVNAGFDLHDKAQDNHLSGTLNYGSGLRTGPLDNESVPQHTVMNLTISHRFDVLLHPMIAVDAFNIFDDIYAYRIATGNIGSAYAPGRTFDVRLIMDFPR